MFEQAGGFGRKALGLAAFTGFAEGVGYLSSPKGPSSWAFRLAEKPAWELPDGAMGPAWTLGLGLLGLSAYRAWQEEQRGALPLWASYLAGNALVSRFGTRMRSSWRNVAGMALLGAYASRAGRRARWLALPYVAWLGYVALAKREVKRRNPLLSRFF